MFEKVPPSTSNVDLTNDLSYTQRFNQYTYRNFYAGGGVALGDVNGDDRLDLYLTANQKRNRLYLNRGGFEFEDVTERARVGGEKPWSTGAAMADVNGDGRLDIYVANSGQHGAERRKNELFINEGDGTFSEQAEAYGVADVGNSIHAAFFDYDRDGDLDLFVLNNYASKPIESYDLRRREALRTTPHLRGGDRLYRNDGGTFAEVTEEAGLYSGEIGFGLGVSVGDVNRDGWIDLYVSNDFFERDYLYINKGDGTFRDEVDRLEGTSSTSMGGDIADLNNDGFPEIYSTDMLPRREERLKTVADFVGWERFRELEKMGYYRTFPRNMLHHNEKNGSFSEIGRYAGVEATAWSWGALMADFNLDGRREIFVANGFYKDVTNKDVLLRLRKKEVRESIFKGGQVDYERLMEMTPSVPLSNYLFENEGALRFENRAEAWGIGEPGFSSGAAYGDLDGDGDLDLVVNNVNDEPFLYRNRAAERTEDRNWLRVALEGTPPNTLGVGAQLELRAEGRRWYAEQMPQRGFQSSVDPTVHVGLGAGIGRLDTLRVRWPDGRVSLRTDVEAGQKIEVRQAAAPGGARAPANGSESTDSGSGTSPSEGTGEEAAFGKGLASGERPIPLLREVSEEVGLEHVHEESTFNDFERSPLLLHMRSAEGPALCAGDLLGNGRTEVYVGGARGQSGALFAEGPDGQFARQAQPALEADREAEDIDCAFVDADGDGQDELYVGSGSSEFAAGSPHLADRLYRAGADEQLKRAEGALPDPGGGAVPTGVVEAAVIGEGETPVLFVGTRQAPYRAGTPDVKPSGYGRPVGGRLLVADGNGTFEKATERWAPGLRPSELGTVGITDAAWGDVDGDGRSDLVLVGEWIPVAVFLGREGRLERIDPESAGLAGTRGWWQSLTLADLDKDGDLDLIGGNYGLNSRVRARPGQPVELWAGDFDTDGHLEQIFGAHRAGEGPYPVALYQHMVQALPAIKEQYETFGAYAETPVPALFGTGGLKGALEEGSHYQAEQLASLVGWNDGSGHFAVDSLPGRVQWAPMYGSASVKMGTGQRPTVLIGGNLHRVRPQIGAYDATDGVFLAPEARREAEAWDLTSGGHYRVVSSRKSGFSSPGEVRAIQTVQAAEKPLILVARTDAALQVFRPVSRRNGSGAPWNRSARN